jgi:hypothetical protein
MQWIPCEDGGSMSVDSSGKRKRLAIESLELLCQRRKKTNHVSSDSSSSSDDCQTVPWENPGKLAVAAKKPRISVYGVNHDNDLGIAGEPSEEGSVKACSYRLGDDIRLRVSNHNDDDQSEAMGSVVDGDDFDLPDDEDDNFTEENEEELHDEAEELQPDEVTTFHVMFPDEQGLFNVPGMLSVPTIMAPHTLGQSRMLLRSRSEGVRDPHLTKLEAFFPHALTIFGSVCLPTREMPRLASEICEFRFGMQSQYVENEAPNDDAEAPSEAAASGERDNEQDADMDQDDSVAQGPVIQDEFLVPRELHIPRRDGGDNVIDYATDERRLDHLDEGGHGRGVDNHNVVFNTRGNFIEGHDQVAPPPEEIRVLLAHAIGQRSNDVASELADQVAALQEAATFETRFPLGGGNTHGPFTLDGPATALPELADSTVPPATTPPREHDNRLTPNEHRRCSASLIERRDIFFADKSPSHRALSSNRRLISWKTFPLALLSQWYCPRITQTERGPASSPQIEGVQ